LAPKELFPSVAFQKEVQEMGKHTGAKFELHHEVSSCLEHADAIYTDVWVSMGEESQYEERIKLLKSYQVNMEMLKKTKNNDVIFLHCLPAFHDKETKVGKEIFESHGLSSMEVTDEVFRSTASKVFDQAENRLHTIKAVMVATIGKI
jgi:ornithine carbamoyltransferase